MPAKKVQRAALMAASALFVSLAGGCASEDFPRSPVNAVLNDREAVRLAELHLDDVAPQASPRDVVTIEATGDGHLVGFHTYFDEPQTPPKQSRLVMVEHDGEVREVTFTD